jgi:hypothetical protein
MILQIVLVVAALGALTYFVRRSHNVRIRASKRLAFSAFIVVNIYAVLRPNDVTWIARHLGIGRGADLVLYMLVVAFVFGMVNSYLRDRELSDALTDLARKVAIRDAELANRDRGLIPTAPATTSTEEPARQIDPVQTVDRATRR